MSYRPTICVDFDGVLHAYTSGWKGATVIPDGPTPGAIKWLCDLADPLRDEDAFKIVVQSSRASSFWGWLAVRRWLRRQIFEHYGCDMVRADDIYASIKVTSKKPAALVYVDDRAWRFDGKTFPTHDELRAHRPWCAVPKGRP
jgi:hypothetical protein